MKNYLKISSFFMLILGIVLFSSCKKEDKEEKSAILVPSKIYSEDFLTEYFYDSQGKIDSISEKNTEGALMYYSRLKIVYNSKGEFFKSRWNYYVNTNDFKYKYYIESTYNRIANTVFVLRSGEIDEQPFSSNYSLVLDDSGRLKAEVWNIDESIYEEQYSYDARSNVSEIKSSNYYFKNASYDTKNGIFKNLSLPQWFLVYRGNDNFFKQSVVNNVHKAVYKYGADNEYSIDRLYRYNEDGYPSEFNSRGRETFKIEYIRR